MTLALLSLYALTLCLGYRLGQRQQRKADAQQAVEDRLDRVCEPSRQATEVECSGPYWLDDNGIRWRDEPKQ